LKRTKKQLSIGQHPFQSDEGENEEGWMRKYEGWKKVV
jgi:hypothetical protein